MQSFFTTEPLPVPNRRPLTPIGHVRRRPKFAVITPERQEWLRLKREATLEERARRRAERLKTKRILQEHRQLRLLRRSKKRLAKTA